MVPTLQTGGGGTEQGLGSKLCSQNQGGITGMVAGRGVLLLEAALMLLIHNHKAETLKGKEDGGAHPEYKVIGLVRELFIPYLHPLCIRKLAVIDAKTGTKDLPETLGNLGGKGNLRQ